MVQSTFSPQRCMDIQDEIIQWGEKRSKLSSPVVLTVNSPDLLRREHVPVSVWDVAFME